MPVFGGVVGARGACLEVGGAAGGVVARQWISRQVSHSQPSACLVQVRRSSHI